MKYLFVLLIAGIAGCSLLKVAEDLDLDRKDYHGDLKMNGYYYFYHESHEVFHVFFLYSNGIYRSLGSIESSSLDQLDSIVGNFANLGSELQYVWGLFEVNRDTIVINRWNHGFGGPYQSVMKTGKILSDNILYFEKGFPYIFSRDSNYNKIYTPEFFKFRIIAKPDSTNNFIK